MERKSPVTVLHFSPRTLGGAILMLALGGESYLMSLHSSAASTTPDVSPPPAIVAPTPVAGATNDHSVRPPEPVVADRPLTAHVESDAKLRVPPDDLKSKSVDQHAVDQHSADQRPIVPANVSPATAPAPGSAEERAAALKGVESLQLQSIIIGDGHRTCIINNVSCEEGRRIDGFTVETIANGSVTVSMGIYRFDLALAR